MPPATSISPGNRSNDIYPGGFSETLDQYGSINRWASSSSNVGHSMFSPEQLYYSLIEREDPNTRTESIIVKTAWYGKQTKAPRHEFIVVQVEDITIPGRINYLVLDRNAETGRGQSIIGSLATFQTIRANDAFKVPHDGDAKKLLKECQLTPHKYLEELSFQPDKPLHLYELVAIAKFVHYRHPNYSVLDSSCYLFAGLVWECLRLLRPLAAYQDDLASQRGQGFWFRYTPKESVIKEAYEIVQARISEIELIFRNRRENLNVGRANRDSEHDNVLVFGPPSEPPLPPQVRVSDAHQLDIRSSAIKSWARLFSDSRYPRAGSPRLHVGIKQTMRLLRHPNTLFMSLQQPQQVSVTARPIEVGRRTLEGLQVFTPAKLNTTLDEHTRFAAEEKSSDNFETEKVIVDDPSQKHLAADQSAAIPSGNGEGPQLIYGDSVPEFEITSETPLEAVVNYFRSNSVLRDYTTDLEHADCSRHPLAIGGLADVYRATLNDGTMVAVKRMRSNLASEGKATKRTARELHTWSRLRHKNILDLLGLALFGEKLAIISPWMGRGNIIGYVENNKDLDRYVVIAQVVEAVVYLHGIDVVHGDLKGDNILVSDEGAIKLADFGLTMTHEQVIRFSTTDPSGGTYRWMAPELIEGEGVRSKETDMYALGMTMLQIKTGKPPFHEIRKELTVVNEIMQNRRPKRPGSSDKSQRDQSFWDILERCWVREPGKRPEASSVKVLISKLLSS